MGDSRGWLHYWCSPDGAYTVRCLTAHRLRPPPTDVAMAINYLHPFLPLESTLDYPLPLPLLLPLPLPFPLPRHLYFSLRSVSHHATSFLFHWLAGTKKKKFYDEEKGHWPVMKLQTAKSWKFTVTIKIELFLNVKKN